MVNSVVGRDAELRSIQDFLVASVPVGLAPASPTLQQNWNVNTILGWPGA